MEERADYKRSRHLPPRVALDITRKLVQRSNLSEFTHPVAKNPVRRLPNKGLPLRMAGFASSPGV